MNESVTPIDQSQHDSVVLSMLPDTGANKSLISYDFLEQNISFAKIKSSSKNVLVANSSILHTLG